MADAADEAIPVEPAPDNHCHGNSDVIHSNGDIELKDMGTRAAEVTNNNTMVEVANNNTTINEECVNCVITDETSTDWARSRFSYNLPLSSDVGLLYSGVAEQADYVEGSFMLTWRQTTNTLCDEVPLEKNSTATLYEIGMTATPSKMNLFIRDCDGAQPQKVQQPVSSTTESVSTTTTINNNTSWTTTSYYSKFNYNAKSDTGFVGLVNQAMTCYLNSLLQTLYMTPEFRNALHRWQFSGEEKEGSKSIPYQLQRLFLHLQMSDKRAVETTDLTRSFGWDSSESWQQHDVQELCRVMFDALEKRFSKDGYERPNLINELYQGTLIDYVKCLECKNESTRESHFLDIPLVIKPFGSNTTYSSVNEALEAFVAPETLDSDNQYHCERCDKKCDAHKGLKFKSFPYLLTLQLMRFDFDYSTMHRIKLNDRMSFPTVLPLNQFIDQQHMPPASDQDPVAIYQDYVVEKFDTSRTYQSNKYSVSGSDNEQDESSQSVDGSELGRLLQQGPYVYELFSIMVHSGSAIGGHYYAYIKSFTDKQWYCFNDQSVSTISRSDLEGTFGGGDSKSKGYYSSMYASSANAYMLMYRRVDKELNKDFMVEDQLPAHIVGQIEEERRRAERERERQEYEKSLCKFRLFCRHPSSGELYERKLEVHQDQSMASVTQQAHQLLGLTELVPVERCRLVKYDEYTETLDQSFEETEGVTFGTLVGGARSYYSFELFLETRTEGETFSVYRRGGLNLKALIISLPSGEVSPPQAIRAEQGWTVQQLKEALAKKLSLPVNTMVVALETYQNEGKPLLQSTQSLKNEGFYRRHTVFVCCDEEDSQRDFKESKMNVVIDRHANTIVLHITVPPPQEDKGSSVDPEHNPINESSTTNSGHQVTHTEQTSGPNTEVTDSSGPNTEVTDTSGPNTEVTDTSGPNTEVTDTSGPNTEVTDTSGPNTEVIDTSGLNSEPAESSRPKQRVLDLAIDRRSTLEQLKHQLEEHVKLPSTQFKVYRVYSNNQEYEMIRLQDSLSTVPTETKLVVRVGRALLPGEFRIKLFLLNVNDTQFMKPILESIVHKGMTIKEFKQQLLEEAYKQGVDQPLSIDRFRLRKKTWKSPGTVYLDHQVIERDIHVFANFEIYVEPLEVPEPMTESTMMQVYVRHWHPATYTVDLTREIILSDTSPTHLKAKISELSGIPLEDVGFAKAHGTFPCEVSVLEIENDLDWNPQVTSVTSMPLSIYDDGSIIYYKNCKEKLAELSAEKRAELQKAENSRLNKYNVTSTTTYNYSRKERALKIYTEEEQQDSSTVD